MTKFWTAAPLVAALIACSPQSPSASAAKEEAPSTAPASAADSNTAANKPVATSGETPAPRESNAPAASPKSAASSDDGGQTQRRAPEWREVTIPAGTLLKVNLNTAVGSDTSRVEDRVRGTLRSPVVVRGVTALPAGAALSGNVTDAARSARVKGRARIAFRFNRIDPPGPDDSAVIRTSSVSRIAPGTKKRDAAKIGAGAVGGAIVGGIVGGGDGAAKGAAIGGAGGTGVVLATRGKEVRMAAGTPVTVRLTSPLTVRVPLR